MPTHLIGEKSVVDDCLGEIMDIRQEQWRYLEYCKRNLENAMTALINAKAYYHESQLAFDRAFKEAASRL
jgi:hypothetical protein